MGNTKVVTTGISVSKQRDGSIKFVERSPKGEALTLVKGKSLVTSPRAFEELPEAA